MLKSVKKATEENEHRQKESIINQMISPLVSIRNKLGVTAMSAPEYTLESLIPKSNVRELFDLTDAKITTLHNHGACGRSKSYVDDQNHHSKHLIY